MGDPNDTAAGSRARPARESARTAGVCLLAVLVCSTACAPRAKVESSVLSPATDFAALRSFAIVPTADADGNVNHGIEEEIRPFEQYALSVPDTERVELSVDVANNRASLTVTFPQELETTAYPLPDYALHYRRPGRA